MKLSRVVVVLSAVLVLGALGFAQAAPQPQSSSTSVSGQVAAAVNFTTGDNTVGTFADGAPIADFEADGTCLPASGSADAKGKATGASAVSPTTANAASSSKISSAAKANGDLGSTVHAIGNTEQGNWAFLGDPDGSFTTGENVTRGNYDAGTVSGDQSAAAAGSAGASGKTDAASTVTTPTSASNNITIAGKSFASADDRPQCGTNPTVRASGPGEIDAISVAGAPTGSGPYAGASLQGKASYNASDGSSASGNLAATGNTSAAFTPTSAQASSSVSANAAAGKH